MGYAAVKSQISRRHIKRIIKEIPEILSGKSLIDRGDLKGRFWANYAVGWWEQVHADFKIKSIGGRGETGRWKPLDKRTIAYSRPIKRGEITALGIGGRGERAFKRRERGLLTKSQNKEWKAIFARMFSKLAPVEGEGEAKKIAAKIAWSILKQKGAQTKIDKLGNRKVPIGIRTGALFAATKPGKIRGKRYYPPTQHQMFEQGNKSITMGIDLPYTSHFHKVRKLWPAIRSGTFSNWSNKAFKKATKAVIKHIQYEVRRNG